MARPLRLSPANYLGRGRYFLTFCTFERRSTFVAILAYCFMPDHVHLLVEACADACDLRRFAKMAKQRSGGVHARTAGQRLWQEGYYDRVLRREDDAYDMARYIFMTPVRAGLARTPTDYPYRGSDVWDIAWLFAA